MQKSIVDIQMESARVTSDLETEISKLSEKITTLEHGQSKHIPEKDHHLQQKCTKCDHLHDLEKRMNRLEKELKNTHDRSNKKTKSAQINKETQIDLSSHVNVDFTPENEYINDSDKGVNMDSVKKQLTFTSAADTRSLKPTTQADQNQSPTDKPRVEDITLLKEAIPSSSTNDNIQDTAHADQSPGDVQGNEGVKVKRKKNKVDLLIITSSIAKNIDGDRLFRHKKVVVHELQQGKNIQQTKQFVTETHLEPKVVQFFVGGNDVDHKSMEHVKEEIEDLMATTRSTFP